MTRAWRTWLGTAAGAVLGAVLLVAALAKAVDPETFAEQIRLEGLAVLLPAGAVAVLAIAIEAGLGGALLLGLRRRWVLGSATALVVFFLFLNARAYWRWSRGLLDEAACGCFGNLVVRTPAEAFWQDLLLLVPALALAFVGRPGRSQGSGRVRLGVAAGLAAASALLAWQAPELPLDDHVTRLAPGVEIASLCAGGAGPESVRICLDGLVPELEAGRHLVVLADPEGPGFAAGVERLNGLAQESEIPRVWLLADLTPEEEQAFFWTWGPLFEVRSAPAALLRPLYRRLPRSFEVRDGLVTATRPGWPEPVAALPPAIGSAP